MIEVKMTGVEELSARLQSLGVDMKTKGGRFALRKASEVIRDMARANAARVNDPETPENIALNIVSRWSGRTFRRTGDLNFRIGVMGGARSTSKAAEYSRRSRARRGVSSLEELGEVAGKGSGNPGGDTFYWRFLEFGTRHMAAQPFMRPAMEQGAQPAVDEFIRQYGKALDRALARAKKAGG